MFVMKCLILFLLVMWMLCGFMFVVLFFDDVGLVLLQVVDCDSGCMFCQYLDGFQCWIVGQQGYCYSVVLCNDSNECVFVVLLVDGLNVIIGEVVVFGQIGYVFDLWQWVEISGWCKLLCEVVQFVFIDFGCSYVVCIGCFDNIGVIGIVVFCEVVCYVLVLLIVCFLCLILCEVLQVEVVVDVVFVCGVVVFVLQFGIGYGVCDYLCVDNIIFDCVMCMLIQWLDVCYDSECNLIVCGVMLCCVLCCDDVLQFFLQGYVLDLLFYCGC